MNYHNFQADIKKPGKMPGISCSIKRNFISAGKMEFSGLNAAFNQLKK